MRRHSKILCVLLAMLMIIAILPMKPVVNADAKTLSVYDLLEENTPIHEIVVYGSREWAFHASRQNSEVNISVQSNDGNVPFTYFYTSLDIDTQEIEYITYELRSQAPNAKNRYFVSAHPQLDMTYGPDTINVEMVNNHVEVYAGSISLGEPLDQYLLNTLNTLMNLINDEFVKHCCFGLHEIGFTNFPANPVVTEPNAGKPFSKNDLNAYFNEDSFDYSGTEVINGKAYNLDIKCDSNELTITSVDESDYKGSVNINFSSSADTKIAYEIPAPANKKYYETLTLSAIIPNTYNSDTELFFIYTYIGTFLSDSHTVVNENANAYILDMLLAADKAIQANSDMSLVDFGFINFSPKTEPKPDDTKDPVTPPAPVTPEPTVEPVVTPVPVTPAPTKAPVATPTPAPTATPEPGLNRFVERLYNVALGRNSEAAGKAYWIDEVKFNGKTASDIAKGFLYSQEFINKSMTNEELLETLYQTFFGRASDAPGKAYWLDKMNNGATKMDVIDGFCNSTEWANLCLTYGVPSGSSATPTITIEPNEGTKAFVARLYQICLDREPDAKGFEYWTYRIANMQESGSSAAAGFFVSNEFVNKGYNNDAYVTFLYKAILDREPDAAGKDYWLNSMKNGMSRSDVLKGFAASTEWSNICTNYGILK